MKNKIKIGLYTSLLIIVLIVMGSSYAMFKKDKTQTNINTVSVLECFNVTYSDTTNSNISITEAYSMTNEEGLFTKPYEFNIANTCDDKPIKISIYIEDVGSTLNYNYLRGLINEKNNLEDKPLIVGSQPTITTSANKTGYFMLTDYIAPESTKNYEFRAWIDENASYASVAGAKFKGKIYVIEDAVDKIMPKKGNLITMNVGTNLPTSYRVMKINGTEAEVLAMSDYNIDTTYAFNTSKITTTFSDGSTGQQYAESYIDKLMNETFFDKMNKTVQSSIVSQNINQYMYTWNATKPSGTQGIDYWESDYSFSTPKTYYITKTGSDSITSNVNVGNRNVYILDVKDVIDYFDNEVFTKEQLNKLFFNQSKSYKTNSTVGNQNLWLRSSRYNYSNHAWYVKSQYGQFGCDSYTNSFGVRPAFTIDLSQIDFTIN